MVIINLFVIFAISSFVHPVPSGCMVMPMQSLSFNALDVISSFLMPMHSNNTSMSMQLLVYTSASWVGAIKPTNGHRTLTDILRYIYNQPPMLAIAATRNLRKNDY